MTVETAEPVVVVVAPAAVPVTPAINSTRRLRVIELILITSVAFATSIFTSIKHVSNNVAVLRYTPAGIADTMFYEALGLALLVYIVFRQGRTWTSFTEPVQWQDFLRGIAVIAAAGILSRSVYRLIQYGALFTTGAWVHPKALHQLLGVGITVLSVSFMLLNPFFEELIVRAYVMTEVRELSKSPFAAVVVSTVLQGSYHLYQGWLNAAYVSGTFLVFSLYYAKTRRIGPVIIAHMFYDLSALIAHH